MDYLPQGSIVRRVNPANFLPLPDALRVAKDILQGLDYLHANSFYHNDIKPENVLVGSVEQSMLSDYGIVGVSSNGLPVPAPGAYRLHMAPEVINGGNISVLTDIYQAGLTLYRLTTGLSALRTKQAALGWNDYYKAIAAGKLVEGPDFPAYVPHSVRRIILRAVDPDPANRFQTALEMRRAVEKLSFPGHWTVDSMGTLIGFSGNHQFRFEKVSTKPNRFSVTAFKKNKISGNETRVSEFCNRDLPGKQADGLIDKFVKNVVTGS
jgi:serine/threonine protein kinase